MNIKTLIIVIFVLMTISACNKEGEYYRISWDEPLAICEQSSDINRYSSGFLGNLEINSEIQYNKKEGFKRIQYIKHDGKIGYTDPHKKASLRVQKNSIIKMQMISGTKDSEIGINDETQWNDSNKVIELEYKVTKDTKFKSKGQEAEVGTDGETHYYWYIQVE